MPGVELLLAPRLVEEHEVQRAAVVLDHRLDHLLALAREPRRHALHLGDDRRLLAHLEVGDVRLVRAVVVAARVVAEEVEHGLDRRRQRRELVEHAGRDARDVAERRRRPGCGACRAAVVATPPRSGTGRAAARRRAPRAPRRGGRRRGARAPAGSRPARASAPTRTVTISLSSPTSASTSANAASAAESVATQIPSGPIAIQSPFRIGPHSATVSRTDCVTSPAATRATDSASSVVLTRELGVRVVARAAPRAPPPPSAWARRPPTCSSSASTWRATATMFLLLGSTMTESRRAALDRLEDLRGRRVHRLAAGDDLLHPEAREQPAHAVADRDRDHRGLDHVLGRVHDRCERGGLGDPALLLHLLEQVGDADVAGPPRLDPGLDRAADVVGVHVAVPQAVATHDHDRVAERRPRRLERGDRGVVGVEQVHDLVPQRRHVAVRGVRLDDERRGAVGRQRDRAAVDDLEERVEQQREALPAGVDHARVPQDRQHLRASARPPGGPRPRPRRAGRPAWWRPCRARPRPPRPPSARR